MFVRMCVSPQCCSEQGDNSRALPQLSVDSVTVSIVAFQAVDLGST